MNKKSKTYQEIIDSFPSCDDIHKLVKLQDEIIHFAGSPYEITDLYAKYEAKSNEIRNPVNSKP